LKVPEACLVFETYVEIIVTSNEHILNIVIARLAGTTCPQLTQIIKSRAL